MRTFIGIVSEPGENRSNIARKLVQALQRRGEQAAIVSLYSHVPQQVQRLIHDLRGADGTVRASDIISYVAETYDMPISTVAVAQTYAVQDLGTPDKDGNYPRDNQYVQQLEELWVRAWREKDEDAFVEAMMEEGEGLYVNWLICDDLAYSNDMERINEHGIVIRITDRPTAYHQTLYGDFTHEEFDPDDFIEEVLSLKEDGLYV